MVAEPEPDPADFRALRLLLRQSKEFRLAIALYNDPVRRDGWIRSLRDELAKDGVRVLTLDLLEEPDRERGLLDRVQALAAEAAPGGRVAIMVVNMETVVDYAPELSRPGGPGTAFLDSANLQRERFPMFCAGPLVLWATELLEQAIIRCAPDLWSWRNHVFDLRTRTVPKVPEFDEQGRPLDSEDFRLHPETRLRRLEEELTAYRRAGSRRDEMRVLNAIGLARLHAGDARLACFDFDAVLRIAREIGDRWGEGAALGNLGLAYSDLGDPRKAIGFYEQDLAIARKTGDRRREGTTLGNLGTAYFDLGDPRKAIGFYEQDLAIARKSGDRRGEGYALGNLGNAHFALGDIHSAIRYYEQSRAISREVGDEIGEGNGLSNLGNAHAALGDVRKAIEYYDQTLAVARKIGDRRGEATALFNFALADDLQGNRPEAINRAEAALAIFETIESPNAAKVRLKLAEWRGERAS